jgi:Zn-dependent M32 family carboxypeptidase
MSDATLPDGTARRTSVEYSGQKIRALVNALAVNYDALLDTIDEGKQPAPYMRLLNDLQQVLLPVGEMQEKVNDLWLEGLPR